MDGRQVFEFSTQKTPLHNAVSGLARVGGADLAHVEALLVGIDVNAGDWASTTPLHMAAAFANDPAVIEALLGRRSESVVVERAGGSSPGHSVLPVHITCPTTTL